MIAILSLTVWLGPSVPALPARAETARSAPGPSDPAEVQAFFDGLIGAQMNANHIAGVAVIVVNAIFTQPFEALAGLAVVVAGLPAYYFWKRQRRERPEAEPTA